jgi:hypothetical protein
LAKALGAPDVPPNLAFVPFTSACPMTPASRRPS